MEGNIKFKTDSLNKPFSELSRSDASYVLNTIRGEIKQINKKVKTVYDPRQFRGAWYWERGFLSCVMAGAKIPEAITADCFRMHWNRIIFEGLYSLRKAGLPKIGWFEEYSLLTALLSHTLSDRFDQSFKDYILEIRDMIGVPGAVYPFAVKVLELCLGAAV